MNNVAQYLQDTPIRQSMLAINRHGYDVCVVFTACFGCPKVDKMIDAG